MKFIRYGQYFIDRNGEGLLAYINNHGFLDNPTFRGMRWHLLRSFDKIYILDLHGNSKRKERSPDGSPDKNVFDIQQGVSINLFVKTGQKKPDALGKIFHFDLFGSRESKYEFLRHHSLNKVKFNSLKPAAPHYFFTPRDYSLESEYQKGFSVADLMPVNVSGIVTMGDKFAIADTETELKKRLTDFLSNSLSESALKQNFSLGKNYAKWITDNKGKIVLKDDKYVRISYRPFDEKWTYFDNKLLWRWRVNVMRHFLAGKNVGLIVPRQAITDNWSHVQVANTLIEARIHYSNKGVSYLFPLYLYPGSKPRSKEQGIGEPPVRKPNLNMDLVKEIAANLKMEFAYENEQRPNAFVPEDLLDYIYAVLHSPGYRETYRELLKTDFPRAPFPADKKQFRTLAELGAELRALHLMESEKLSMNKPITEYTESGDDIVRQVKREKDKVRINKTQYFAKIPDDAWNFHIGGFQPAQKYLKDRKNRRLTLDEIDHYQKIIIALVETAKIMQKIDAHLPLKTS